MSESSQFANTVQTKRWSTFFASTQSTTLFIRVVGCYHALHIHPSLPPGSPWGLDLLLPESSSRRTCDQSRPLPCGVPLPREGHHTLRERVSFNPHPLPHYSGWTYCGSSTYSQLPIAIPDSISSTHTCNTKFLPRICSGKSQFLSPFTFLDVLLTMSHVYLVLYQSSLLSVIVYYPSYFGKPISSLPTFHPTPTTPWHLLPVRYFRWQVKASSSTTSRTSSNYSPRLWGVKCFEKTKQKFKMVTKARRDDWPTTRRREFMNVIVCALWEICERVDEPGSRDTDVDT